MADSRAPDGSAPQEPAPTTAGPFAGLHPNPFSYFTESTQLNADEARRAIQGRTLGYVGIIFHTSRQVLCRTCHQAMTAGTSRYIPNGYDGAGYCGPVYACEDRRPNVDSKCNVCANPVIGEVAGG